MDGGANHCAPQLGLLCPVFAAALLGLTLSSKASAQVTRRFPSTLPRATIISDETAAVPGPPEASPDEEVAPVRSTSPGTAHSYASHRPSASELTDSAAVEPTHAMLKLKKDAWAYAGPEASSRTIERVHAGKFVNVTGSTHYYVQVKLKNGATGYGR
jgi:hypothetical protein